MKWLDPAWWHGLETLIGLECPTDPEGTYRILRLRKDQQRIKRLDAVEIMGLDQMLAAIARYPKLPIVLVPNGFMVMERLLPADATADPVVAVLGVGVGDSSEFEVMRFPADAHRTWTALMRKDALAACRQRLGTHQQRVVTAVFSPAVGMYLLPQAVPALMEKNVVMCLAGKEYHFKQGLLCGESEHASHGFEQVYATAIAQATETDAAFSWLYASLLYAWLQSSAHVADLPMATQWRDYRATSRLRQMATMAALGLFIWFACLFSLRIQGERRKAELESQYSQNLPVLNAIHQLDEKIAAREDLGHRLGSQTLKPSRASFYLDRIAAVMPPTIHLLEIVVGPVEEDFKRQGMRDMQQKEVILRGESAHSAPIAQFSEALQAVDGLHNIVVERSEMNFQTGLYEFIFLANTTNPTAPSDQ